MCFRLCCSRFSFDEKFLCSGFEDSSLRMWSLTPKTIYSENPEVNVSHVNLATDYVEDIQDKSK